MGPLVAQEVGFSWPGPVRAVDSVSLEVTPGALLCVLGPNGAGKTTLVKLLSGSLAPDRGSVTLDGRSLSGLYTRTRAREVAVVPQALAHIPEVSVDHFVLSGRYGHLGRWRQSTPRDRAVACGALAEADVADLADRGLRELSAGQLQRVLIARALAQETSVLLVDEPTSSLDPEHQLQVFELLHRLKESGRAVLAVTHDLNLASQFATSLAVIQDGRVVAMGTAAEVLRPPVLQPVYGDRLRYGSWPGPDGSDRPFVVPWIG